MARRRIVLVKGTDKDVEEAYEDFMKYGEARNLSPATMRYYRQKLTRFIGYLVDNNLKETGDISDQIIHQYIIYLKTNYEVNPRSVNTHLRAVKAYVNYCIEYGYIETKVRVKLLKTQDNVKPTYTDRELEILLEKPDLRKTSFVDYRDWVIVNWLLATGTRLGTMANVKIKDLDFEKGLLYLNTTKSKKALVIPMSTTLSKVLTEYLKYREGESEEYLFCTAYRTRLNKSGMRQAIRRYHHRRGVKQRSIHQYRHTFAKLAILNGIDPLRLQKILGHSTLEMTRKYVNLYGQDLKDGFDEYNPLEQLIKNKN